MDHEQESAPGFEPVPPETDEQPMAGDPGDDSDAPIRLDELAPDETPPPADAANDSAEQHVRADNVTLTQASAQSIEASNVSISQGGAARVVADELSVSQGGVALARTESLTVQSEGSAFAVMAETATVEPGGNVFLLIARSISGEVRPVLDWRAALALGGGFALVMSILRRLR